MLSLLQTVWLEAAPAAYITAISAITSLQPLSLQLTISCSGTAANRYVLTEVISPGDSSDVVASGFGLCNSLTDIPLPADIELWSPDSPTLYDLAAKLTSLTSRDLLGASASGGTAGPFVAPSYDAAVRQLLAAPELDRVRSYVGVRVVSKCLDAARVLRVCLNGRPVFPFGELHPYWHSMVAS